MNGIILTYFVSDEWCFNRRETLSYVYWTVHHLDSWIKINQLMSLVLFFAAKHVSNASIFIFIPTHSRKLLKMNVLAFETCWAAKNKTSDISWSIFIQLLREKLVYLLRNKVRKETCESKQYMLLGLMESSTAADPRFIQVAQDCYGSDI